jgi:hypothetical protein
MNIIALEVYKGWHFIALVVLAQGALIGWFSVVMHRNRAGRLRGDFWKILQTRMVNLIHHPHIESRELDVLLEKLESDPNNKTGGGLTPADRNRLEELLKEKANDPSESKDERNSAEFLLIAMREVVRDTRKNAPPI